MSSSKATPSPQPSSYRDDPDEGRAETASMSSAVLLDDIEAYPPEEELPAYAELPGTSQVKLPPAIRPQELAPYTGPPPLLLSTHDIDSTEIRTRFPAFSESTESLLSMLHSQADFPPTYCLHITGEHTETSRSGNKESKNKVQDFFLVLNLTPLLQPGYRQGGYIELLPDNKRGYRGSIFPTLKPSFGTGDAEEQVDEIRSWCDHYIENPAKIKSFMLKREVTNHDTKKVEQLVRAALSETNYRGHVDIRFSVTHKRLIVYSPGLINQWRMTTWIRWIFYITFLWLITWPLLFLFTKKYEVIKVVYPYADKPTEDGEVRTCTVMSESEWYQRWENTIKRAALARMRCEDAISEDYRMATEQAELRGQIAAMQPRQLPQTGNAYADGALGILSQGLQIAENWSAQRGWGGDC